ncbi:PREDICTED: THO complex subunit 2-like, partial [Priapulus caudatus]|uniref:THO complex subunit 2-like n=1 Tax=Priapulus caudatus TaxID=37621 RepID=A0ABM1F323_PRICU
NHGLPAAVFKSPPVPAIGKGMRVVREFRELRVEVFPILRSMGPYLAHDPVLIAKVIRLGTAFMKERKMAGCPTDMEPLYCGFLAVIDEVVLPSLSTMEGNCCMAEELWTMLKHVPYTHRYRLYAQWKNDTYSQHPILIKIKSRALDRTRYIM